MEAVGSELNLFEPFLNQTAMIAERVHEIATLATIMQLGPNDFQIKGSRRTCLYLKDSKVVMKVNLKTASGANIANNVIVSSLNLLLFSLFKSVTMKIQDNGVNESYTV